MNNKRKMKKKKKDKVLKKINKEHIQLVGLEGEIKDKHYPQIYTCSRSQRGKHLIPELRLFSHSVSVVFSLGMF
jgi:hypothetical protein